MIESIKVNHDECAKIISVNVIATDFNIHIEKEYLTISNPATNKNGKYLSESINTKNLLNLMKTVLME